VHDQLATGRRFRVLNIVDDVTRECLAPAPVEDTSISGRRVVRELGDLIDRARCPEDDPARCLTRAHARQNRSVFGCHRMKGRGPVS